MANPRPRRRAMLGCIGVAGALVVLDTTLFGDGLRARPVLFVVYWLVCAWLTLLAVLLAVLDLLVLRAQGRRARRELRERLTREGDEP